ncbi:efflux RND transporter periplasmic adaptor subunit [Macrococcus bovicus]|uniref:YknX-like barrel-sandwich hybrid domain-containing protein n=1 Tax=Macrococcus bovicus TaxID=69968 RepID=A0A4R6BY55_9STAP|nr:efflux RND transporter periplasmic adaptor subunit [Macrococcus bovicus]TDM13013.1 hypothetical protein ERX55_10005 [Macrococcus bovicus]
MKRKWLWPLLLTLLIFAMIAGSAVYMAYQSHQAENTIYIDDFIKKQTIIIKGKVVQHQATYYLKPAKNDPVKVHVKEGEKVAAGNPLYTYREADQEGNTELSLQLDNKRVEKEQIEGQITAYEERLAEATSEESASIEAQINWLESELTKAENNISILEEKQKKQEDKVGALTIKASQAGTILDIDDDQLQSFTAVRQDKPVLTMSVGKPYFEGYARRSEVELLSPVMPFESTDDSPVKGSLTKVALTPRDELRGKSQGVQGFLIEGRLDKTDGLYLGDRLSIAVHPSKKGHIWLPEKYVKKVMKADKPEYFVKKVYGSDKNEAKVMVEKEAEQYYLVTQGLSAIDKLEAYKK